MNLKSPSRHRRSFLQRAGTALGGSLAAGFAPRLWSAVPGANGDVRVVIIGLGNKGKQHVAALAGAALAFSAALPPGVAPFLIRGTVRDTSRNVLPEVKVA